jgi:transcription elongation factor GreA
MQEIRDRLAAELKQLEYEFRIELPREIKTAVSMGDLRENAEYHAAIERQAYVRARIGQLRERLAQLAAVNLGQVPRDRAALGSRVTLLDRDSGAEVRYELVFPELADAERGWISVASPIGKSLLNRQEGDEMTIEVPAGRKRFELIELETLHDRADGEGADGQA